MTAAPCPFCALDPAKVFYQGTHVVGLWDGFPVSPGHALLVPRRHVETWFDASADEQHELIRAIDVARAAIETAHRPDGFNIGINVREAAGQTVFHLHVHVIPRYRGDVPDPRGGVRHVIPARARDMLAAGASTDTSALAPLLVRGDTTDPLLPHLITHLGDAVSVDLVVSFLLDSGVRLLEPHLRDVLERGGQIRILTGDYLGVTEPEALLRLADLEALGGMALRIFESQGRSFHPKSYILTSRSGERIAFVGSSNLSDSGLRRGVEWNYRLREKGASTPDLTQVTEAFEALWVDARVRPVTSEWIQGYREKRAAPLPRTAGVEAEAHLPPPRPHSVQLEALAALEETRVQGNTAGLVVLATGLGKTWLSAFDSYREEFQRVLFVAHREEILQQAMQTFRRIRPGATLGLYTGGEKTPEADVLFASVQTLGRARHLQRFDRFHFDYIVVDEFHHAAALTYRRVLSYFEPKFLLGLTATPERTDGSDLLGLCGNNLIYRCDLADGIRRGLLSPFDYYGVPDDLDYQNIPWRSNRFDLEKLTDAVATRARADNALAQYRKLGRARTIAFCVSQRHADFMADAFVAEGLRAVAVHSGPKSAPRTASLEALEAGELDVVFSVDMFNEGVDLPSIDTVMMLRPTESRILWLQQFGRGLRVQDGKTLRVIDYIGNHRIFLNKAQALFGLGSGDREVAFALDRLDAGTLELPPGCAVTYELETKEILRGLIRTTQRGELLEQYYRLTRETRGTRPLALEALNDGYDPRAARRGGWESWLGFVEAMDDLTQEESEVRARTRDFLDQLERTELTRSYKLMVLLAMLADQALPGSITVDRLVERVAHLARRHATLRNEFGATLSDPAALRALLEKNPIPAWTGGRGTGGVSYFSYADGVFRTTFSPTLIGDGHKEAFQDLVHEIVEWRLAEYMGRSIPGPKADRIVTHESADSGPRRLVLPNRESVKGIPTGWQRVLVNDLEVQLRFDEAHVEDASHPGGTENILADVLDSLPRPPGTGLPPAVVFARQGDAYRMMVEVGDGPPGPALWNRFTRKEAFTALGTEPSGWELQSGVVQRPGGLILFVTLEKGTMPEAHRYEDAFLSPSAFQWQSQNKTRQSSEMGKLIKTHHEAGLPVHLFVRRAAKAQGTTQPFVYCGTLDFDRWEGEQPITVWWTLNNPVPTHLQDELKVGDKRSAGG